MSCLLFCALVALLPQALGNQEIKFKTPKDIKFNNTLLLHQKPLSTHKVLLNLNGQRMVVKLNEIHSVLDDFSCFKCLECMKRAIKADKSNSILKNRSDAEELHQELVTNQIHRRMKRDIEYKANSDSDTKKDKKNKSKKVKPQKSVTVTKYNLDGEVFALKVKESNTTIDDLNDKMFGVTCQVYSINKSHPCDSPEGDLIVASAKRKMTKREKKEKDTTKVTKKPDIILPMMNTAVFRKRQVDNNYQNSQLPENVMPSIEEFY